MRRRRKPRLFSFPYEVELSHFDGVITDPEGRKVLRGVLEAFIEIAHNKRVTESSLGLIVAAARHRDPQLRGLATLRLTVLCHYFQEAVDELALLCGDIDPETRLFVAPMLANTPNGVCVPLVQHLLEDEDWRVRKAAALVGTAVPIPELLAIFSRRIARERDARVRVVLQIALDFQRRQSPRGDVG